VPSFRPARAPGSPRHPWRYEGRMDTDAKRSSHVADMPIADSYVHVVENMTYCGIRSGDLT